MREIAEEFLLEDAKNYRYLTQGNVSVAGQDDAELYRQLVEAMDIMGFSKDEQDGTLLACVLQYIRTYRVAQKSKPLPNDQKIVLNRIKACQQDYIYLLN